MVGTHGKEEPMEREQCISEAAEVFANWLSSTQSQGSEQAA